MKSKEIKTLLSEKDSIEERLKEYKQRDLFKQNQDNESGFVDPECYFYKFVDKSALNKNIITVTHLSNVFGRMKINNWC